MVGLPGPATDAGEYIGTCPEDWEVLSLAADGDDAATVLASAHDPRRPNAIPSTNRLPAPRAISIASSQRRAARSSSPTPKSSAPK